MTGERMFIIRPEDTAALRALLERMRKRPITIEMLRKLGMKEPANIVKLEDRPTDFRRPESEFVIVPEGYRISMSVEEQPHGMCLHLSMSSPEAGKVPRPEAALMVLEVIGVARGGIVKTWLEEFEPGHMAANILVLMEERAGGHA
jgi:hypothetical protein